MTESRYYKEVEMKSLVNKFVCGTLPAKEWTHTAHLTVGLWFVAHYGRQEASVQLPKLIRKYNEIVGTENTETSGYHETITQFWIWLLDCYWQQVRQKMSVFNACNYLITSPFGDPSAFLKFYSKPFIFSKEARKENVSPDIQPLDSRLIGHD